MNELFRQSLFAGAAISLIAYEIGLFLKTWLGGFKSAAGFDYSCNHSIERFWNQL